MTATNQQEIYRAKVNLETSQIAWKGLQRYCASSVALAVADDLDLVEVAFQMSEDNTTQIRQWMVAGKFGKVLDEQTCVWFESDALLWAVVDSPWVLAQQVHK